MPINIKTRTTLNSMVLTIVFHYIASSSLSESFEMEWKQKNCPRRGERMKQQKFIQMKESQTIRNRR